QAKRATRTIRKTAQNASHGNRHSSHAAEWIGGCAMTPVGNSTTAAIAAAVMCQRNTVRTTALPATTAVHGPVRRSHRLAAGWRARTTPTCVAASAISATVGGVKAVELHRTRYQRQR